MSNGSVTPPVPPAGTIMYHTSCIYHGSIGIHETTDECNAAAADHITTQHCDSDGNVAPTAEVQITTVVHFSTVNALEVKRRRAQPDESKST